MAFNRIRSGIRTYTDGVVNRFIDGRKLEPNLDYWRDVFFAYIVAILLPFVFLPLIPGLYLAFSRGFYWLVAGDLLVVALFFVITFVPGIPIRRRKIIFTTGLYFISLLLLYYLGSYGPGLTFLYAITVFVVLITRKQIAMFTVLINLLICTLFGVALWLGFQFPFQEAAGTPENSVLSWISVSSFGLIFSFLAAMVIPKLFEGLQNIIDSQKLLEKKLNSMLQEVETKNSELEEFAYTASHDLKEPLRMVRSFMELLRKNYMDRLDDRAGKYIHFAVDGAERMGKLIDDLLHYSRIGRIHTEVEEIDLATLLREITERFQRDRGSAQLKIETGSMPLVDGVRVSLEMLFTNLIGNAIKYQPAGNTPEIRVESYSTEKYFHFRVTDNGIGIAKEYQGDIFKIFKRLHTDEEYEGSGLGLAICKKIVTQHGGEIRVSSEPERGSTFEFTLLKKYPAT